MDLKARLPEFILANEKQITDAWIAHLANIGVRRDDLIAMAQRLEQCHGLLKALAETLPHADRSDIHTNEWQEVRDHLAEISKARARMGFKPSEVCGFVLALKAGLQPIIDDNYANDSDKHNEISRNLSDLIDKLTLWTVEVFEKSYNEIIQRQQQELVELSTPVVNIWEGVLALPLIGTLDSSRTQVVMESLLQKIVETGAELAIIDITGVATVDTLVAQHLIKTVTAARLMGADCIISGIRPAIAQTMVHLGINLNEVTTKATMADALRLALHQRGAVGGKLPNKL